VDVAPIRAHRIAQDSQRIASVSGTKGLIKKAMFATHRGTGSLYSNLRGSRRITDLLGWRGLGHALNEEWTMNLSMAGWRVLLEPAPQRTLHTTSAMRTRGDESDNRRWPAKAYRDEHFSVDGTHADDQKCSHRKFPKER